MNVAELSTALQQVLSGDNIARAAAERELDRLSQAPGFSLLVAQCACSADAGFAPAVRLVSLSVLKQKITLGSGPEELLEVCQMLICSLCNPEAFVGLPDALLRQVAATASKAVSLLERMCTTEVSLPVFSAAATVALECIASGLPSGAPGRSQQQALTFVSELLEVLGADSVIRMDMLVSVPDFFVIALAEEAATPVERLPLRMQALGILKSIYLWGLVMLPKKSEGSPLLKAVWARETPRLRAYLLQSYCEIQEAHLSPDLRRAAVAHRVELFAMVIEVLAVSRGWKGFLDAAWAGALLHSLGLDAAPFQCMVASEERDRVENVFVTVRQFVAKRWSLFECLLRLPSLRMVIVDVVKASNVLPFLQLLMSYAYLDAAECEEWGADPNAYLRGEEDRDDGVGWTVRDTVVFVFQRCIKLLGPLFVRTSLEHLHSLIFATDCTQPWRDREVALFFMELFVKNSRKELVAYGAADFMPLISLVIQRDAVVAVPVLAARALSLLGVLLNFVKTTGANAASISEVCAMTLPQAVSSLGPNSQPLLRAVACKLLLDLLPLFDVDLLVSSYEVHGAAALLALISTAETNGEFLYLVLDVFKSWTKRIRLSGMAATASASLFPQATYPVLFQCWRTNIQDPNIGDSVVDALREAVFFPSADPGLLPELLWMRAILCGRCAVEEFCSAPHVIRVLYAIFRNGSDAAASEAAQLMLEHLCHLLLSTDESGILEAASTCFVALLERCPNEKCITVFATPSLVRAALEETLPLDEASSVLRSPLPCFDEERVSFPLTTVFLAVLVRMLHDRQKEVALFNVSLPLVAVVERAPSFSAAEVRHLIRAIVCRLTSVRTDTAAEQLIIPLGSLLRLYPDAFVASLKESGLLLVAFGSWLPRVGTLSRCADVLRSCEGLIQLLGAWAQFDLDGVMVPWPSVTASMAKRGRKAPPSAPSSLPLAVAMFVAVGKGLATLLFRLERTGTIIDATDEEDGKGGLWNTDCNDVSDGDEEGWEDDAESDSTEEEAGANPPATSANSVTAMAGSDRPAALQTLASTFAPLRSLAGYAEAAASFFSSTEMSVITAFLASVVDP